MLHGEIAVLVGGGAAHEGDVVGRLEALGARVNVGARQGAAVPQHRQDALIDYDEVERLARVGPVPPVRLVARVVPDRVDNPYPGVAEGGHEVAHRPRPPWRRSE